MAPSWPTVPAKPSGMALASVAKTMASTKKYDRRYSRVVIIGAGIVGTNLADELIALGWQNITVVEQGPLELPGGSTSHAPGLVFQTNPSRNMSLLAQYTVNKLSKLQHNGQSCFNQVGGLEVATTPARLEELKRRHGFARASGMEARLLTTNEVLRIYPSLNADLVLGGLHIPSDGLASAARTVQVLMERTRKAGVVYIGHALVTDVMQSDGYVTGVKTTKGTLQADLVISCAGFWGVEVGNMVQTKIPLLPLGHQYAKTSRIAGLGGLNRLPDAASLPILRHQDQDLYFREWGDRYGIGYYGHQPMPVVAASLGPTPHKVNEKEMPSRLPFTPADFEPAWKASCDLIPLLKDTTMEDGFNGIFSFTPDGAPIVGEAPTVQGFWFAEAIWVTHSAGIARALAEILSTGHSRIDIHECDLARFEDMQLDRSYVSETSQQNFVEVYDIIHPLAPIESPRNLKCSAFYPQQVLLGAHFSVSSCWECPAYYTTNISQMNHLPSYWKPGKRDAWSQQYYSDAVAVETWKTRNAVAMYDLTSFKRVEVRGPGAEELLQRLTTANVAIAHGTITHTLFLDKAGGILGDTFIARLGSDLFELSVNGATTQNYLTVKARSQSKRNPSKQCAIRDVTGGTCGIGVWGPKSKGLMRTVNGIDAHVLEMPYASCRKTSIANIPVVLWRVSSLGEFGWEIYTSAEHGHRLWTCLWQAGQAYGVAAAGSLAFDALRIEAGKRSYGKDMTTEHTPEEAGLSHLVDSTKKGYIGYDAIAQRPSMQKRLCCLVIDDGQSVVMGKEPVLLFDKPVGYVTSAAFGYSIGKPVAYAWLPATVSAGATVEIEYFARRIRATVVAEPLFSHRGTERALEQARL